MLHAFRWIDFDLRQPCIEFSRKPHVRHRGDPLGRHRHSLNVVAGPLVLYRLRRTVLVGRYGADMDFHEALLVWAQEKRRRDRGEPFTSKVIPAVRVMFKGMLDAGQTIDPSLPRGLAVGPSGTYDVDAATDEDMLTLAEDMYQENRARNALD